MRYQRALYGVASVATLVGGLFVAAGLAAGAKPPPVASTPPRAAAPLPVEPLPSPVRSTAPDQVTVPAPVTFPAVGGRRYLTVPGAGPVLGSAGRLMRYRISVESDIAGLDVDGLAAFVEQTYADPRGWTAEGKWRFQRVDAGQPAEFTLYLVTPATRDYLCASGYDRFTSCRNGASVVLNVARWTQGVPDYGAPLDVYRQYMINHETGHRLGNGHELCPAAGAPAPVMEQQTLGLHGCRANAWPYIDGRRYRGPSGQYSRG